MMRYATCLGAFLASSLFLRCGDFLAFSAFTATTISCDVLCQQSLMSLLPEDYAIISVALPKRALE